MGVPAVSSEVGGGGSAATYTQTVGAWNEFLSSMMYMPPPEERRMLPAPTQAQLNKIHCLQLQHQQLQLQQLHLLNEQHKVELTLSSAPSPLSSVLEEAVRNAAGTAAPVADAYISPSPALPALPVSVWQNFQQLQATQWSQAIELVRASNSDPAASAGAAAGGAGGSVSSFADAVSDYHGGQAGECGGSGSQHQPLVGGGGGGSVGKRCKAYAAPKGVWKNNGGFNATIYVHKRRIYGPIRRDLNDAIEDRREMEEALKMLMDAGYSDNPHQLETEMRDVVARLRGKVRIPCVHGHGGMKSQTGNGMMHLNNSAAHLDPMSHTGGLGLSGDENSDDLHPHFQGGGFDLSLAPGPRRLGLGQGCLTFGFGDEDGGGVGGGLSIIKRPRLDSEGMHSSGGDCLSGSPHLGGLTHSASSPCLNWGLTGGGGGVGVGGGVGGGGVGGGFFHLGPARGFEDDLLGLETTGFGVKQEGGGWDDLGGTSTGSFLRHTSASTHASSSH